MREAVLTLADLDRWSFAGAALAVLGHPIAHSLSPPMHNAALAELARTEPSYADWRYFRFDVPPADLPRALALLHARRFRGVNLTIPHKIIALDCVAEVDPAARPAGAVNTLRWTEGGWRGFDTDGYGLATAVRERLGFGLRGASVLLLGAGGAARAAAIECLQGGCAALWLANRTQGRLDALVEHVRPFAGKVPVRALMLPLSFGEGRPSFAKASEGDSAHGAESAESAGSAGSAGLLVINATSAGLQTGDAAPLDLRSIPRPAGVFDMIYNPPRTALLEQAAALGLPHANGLAMLVHQGAKSLEIWTGIPAERTAPVMLGAAERALAAL